MVSDGDFNRLTTEVRRMAEVVRTLNGEVSQEKKAVLFNQLAQLKTIRTEMKSKPLTTTPTTNDFNLLLNDVRELYAKIIVVANALT